LHHILIKITLHNNYNNWIQSGRCGKLKATEIERANKPVI